MSSKGYIRIPDSQILLERRNRMKHRTWHQHIMNLLLGKNVCGSCLRIEDELIHWDAEFVMLRYDHDIESSLKNIMMSTFGPSVTNIIPTANFCKECVDAIVTAHLLIFQLRNNCKEIQKKLAEISQQMKWTTYLNEHGGLIETVNDKTNLDDDNSKTTPIYNVKDLNDPMEEEKSLKTHKIILNNESLKNKLLQEPNMHKFLVNDEAPKSSEVSEAKLPAGITVRKVRKSVDMSDFAPQDLLELNWAEDENVSVTAAEPDKKLQSNEALIMNLMEEAKTVEKHKHFHDNLKLQVNKALSVVEHTNDSLSVKLVQNETEEATVTNENESDNEDLVPQDLLELKWPEEQNTTQTKIPVKKLNFNEALTVKYIPSHKPTTEDGDDEVAPHELLELNWNEAGVQTSLPQAKQKHSIDLTQWLQDQGMSTIKTKGATDNSNLQKLNNDIETQISKKTKVENIHKDTKEFSENNKNQMIVTGKSRGLYNCNISVKNLEVATEQDENIIKCALCDVSFIQYESYSSHYKTHNISEPAKCYRCGGKFPVIELLVEHLLLVHSEDMAYCTLCFALLNQSKVAKHMVDYHAKKVEIINAASTIPLVTKDGHCKRCDQLHIDSPNTPHICVFRLDCPACSEECIHEKYLKSYIEQVKANKVVFKCTDCEYLYKTKHDIVRHANVMHLKHYSHQCVVCKTRFSTQFELSNHNYSRHFPCEHCKKVFADTDILLAHGCPRELANLTCESCGQKFIARRVFDQHKNTAAAVTDHCTLCRDTVTNRCNMARHMQVVHQASLKKTDDGILHQCIICRKSHHSDIEFKQHVCLHECRICAKRFTTKILLDNHMQNHNLKQLLMCTVCNLKLLNKFALSQHMLKHRGHEQCPVCSNYIQKTVLPEHIESHNDPKNRFKCPHCSLVCENRNQFEVHVNRFHLLTRPYQCDMCKKSYYSKHKLREHIRQHSSEARRERCTLCGKKFARKHTLEKHMKLHSTGQLYNCDMCDKRYISVVLLNQHRFSHRENDSKLPKAETSQSSQNEQYTI